MRPIATLISPDIQVEQSINWIDMCVCVPRMRCLSARNYTTERKQAGQENVTSRRESGAARCKDCATLKWEDPGLIAQSVYTT